MQQWLATLIGAGVIVLANLLLAAFIYGKLTERVAGVSIEAADNKKRVGNVETVLMGPGGHGERLAALEAWRIEHRAAK